MNERKWAILEAIIREYILTAEPVGSRTLNRRYDFGISAATIRNEMADLEELGYLEQPHTSAGRIPSDKGYRSFVDSLINANDLPSISQEVQQTFRIKKQQIHELVQETTKLLSQFTHYVSVGLAPDVQQTVFQHLQLIPLTERKVVAVLVTDSGLVQNKIFNVPAAMGRKELSQISEFLNDRLQGVSFQKINHHVMKQIEAELVSRYDIMTDVVKTLYSDLLSDINRQIQQLYLEGTSFMIDQPEFADINKFKTVMNLLEQRELLSTALNENPNDNLIHISIGQENAHKEMQSCSLISATYSFKGKPLGKIGIIGPTRMEYGKVISTVQYVANILSKVLSEQDD